MKNKKWLAAVLAAVFCLSGCGAAVHFDEQALMEKSEVYTQALIDGDYASAAAGISPSVASGLNADVLKQGWESTAPSLGAFESMEASSFSASGAVALVDVSCSFENRGLLLRYTYNGKNELTGLWMTYVPKKAQPQNTDAYEERVVSVGSEDAPLEGILTLPKGAEKSPAVLLIAGSGQQDMDETTGAAANKPLADIARGLAQQGIASLRYNKRTAQYPDQPADLAQLTIQYEVLDDAAAAADLLKQTAEIDTEHIYVLGHSLGGMLAPKIAQDSGLAGLISLAGSPRSLEDIMLDQNKAALASLDGVSEEDKQTSLENVEKLIDQARSAKEGGTDIVLNATENYWYTLNQIDTPGIAQALDVPMLFLQGEEDFQVFPEKDFTAWQELLGGRENVQFKLYPGLNHLFMPAGGTGTTEDYDAPASVDSQVIGDIASWIHGQAHA